MLGQHDGPPVALQLRNLQTLVELGVDNNTTVVFPAPLMSAIGDVGSFFARETAAASAMPTPPIAAPPGRRRRPNRGREATQEAELKAARKLAAAEAEAKSRPSRMRRRMRPLFGNARGSCR